MKALVLYAVFLIIGAVGSALVGIYVERQVSSAVSLLVFLPMFFANFVICWLAVILVMDGSLKNAQGRQDQRDVETAGRRLMDKRG